MISVIIYINQQPIVLKSARNMLEFKDGESKYMTDCGKVIWHKREDGAVKLVNKILEHYKEPDHD